MARVIHTRSQPSCAGVYDHNAGERAFLAVAAEACRWREERLDGAWSDREVAEALAKHTSALGGTGVLIVHVDEDGLEALERESGERVTIVACSTAPEKVVSEVPDAGRPLLLRLRRRLDPGFSGEVLEGLVGALDRAAIESLRLGRVPEGLRGQFAFRESPLVYALLILVQGAIGAEESRRRDSVNSVAWWRMGLGIRSAATVRDGLRAWRVFVSELALELSMEWGELRRRAPESERLLRSLRSEGGRVPGDCDWPKVKEELERLL